MRRWPARGAITLMAVIAAAADAATPAKPDAVRIPFRLDAKAIVVDVRLGAQQKALPFVLDSGLSDGNVLSAKVATTLGLKTDGDLQYGDTGGSAHAAKRAKLASICVGPAVLEDQPFAVADLPPRPLPDGEGEIAGFLGAPLLAGAVLCLDYREHRLLRTPREAFAADGLTVMPMKRRHGLPTAQVIVDGVPAVVVVDTGYDGGIAVFPAFANSSGLRERYPDLRATRGDSGSGDSFTVLQGTAEEVALSQDTRLPKVPLALVPQAFDPAWGIDGLIGYEVLSRLDPCLDRDGQRLLWKPPA